MQYREIVAITGLGGLFQLLTTKSDGAIVKSLADNSTKFISARLHNVTPLDSIEIYTIEENIRLSELFSQMKEQEASKPLVDHKKASNEEIKNYISSVYPNIDLERVYISDMKKMLKWYEILKSSNLLSFEVATEEAAHAIEAPQEAAVVAEKPAKKARAKKVVTEGEEAAEKPAKKTAAKKKKED
ncbi:MAG: DUF5606 domain-containing protein [Bacteroidota bacterium]